MPTDAGNALLAEASGRVRGAAPFDPKGGGWTLVTFSIPEDRRALRHRVRSTLTWEGFAPLRDGLWLAPGEVDLRASLLPLSGELDPGTIVAFRARELADFPIAASVRQAWDIDVIRAAHRQFAQAWGDPGVVGSVGSALLARTQLVADWLLLLRTDPGLPPEYMDE
ncbi:MAG: PadR family transcriptional regulator, partial [Actinobacteria bacterium]|nr:PadR family transcriptional regulator [Actinomycetota bacterium]